MEQNIILSIKNISKLYNKHKQNEIIACNEINFSVYTGEFLAIVGESGSGKSTLVKIISNLEKKSSGEVIFENRDITNLSEKELRLHRKDIQLVFQDANSSLNPKMTIQNIICEPLINFNLLNKRDKKLQRETAIEFLKKVELDESFLNKKPSEMSGGQRQRVSIAKALTLNPKILILDEPTSALDVITQNKIVKLLHTLQRENQLTIIFVCHDLALVTKVSHRIAVMYRGDLMEIIDPQCMVTNQLHPYTKELIEAVFDVKKCGCRFNVPCLHESIQI